MKPAGPRGPEHEVARRYMLRKGYRDARPDRVLKISQATWAFEYDLHEGMLTLEVSYADGRWDVAVYDYVAA